MGGTIGVPTGNKVVCNLYTEGIWIMSVGWGRVKSWQQGKKIGQLCWLPLWTLNILQRVFQKNSLSLKGCAFQLFKRVANFSVPAAAKGNQESVGIELDAVAHHG